MSRLVHPWHEVASQLKLDYRLTESGQVALAEALWEALMKGEVIQRNQAGMTLKPHEAFEVPLLSDSDSPWVWSEDVNVWLKGRFPFVWQPKKNVEKKTSVQHQLILDAIKDKGYKPQCLPPIKNGIASVKAYIRQSLNGCYPFEAKTSFDKAWQDLRNFGEIKYNEP